MGNELDPQIKRFVQELGAAWASHPGFDAMTPGQQRAVAEVVRAPWAAGGPVMNRTTEWHIPTSAGKVRVRVHNPSDGAHEPALVYLHGGGWTIFSIDTHDRLMREYAARANVVVIGVDYERSPEARFPTALNQVVDVVRWLRENAAAVDVDAERIAVGGDSAGGNLTVATCLSLRDAGESDAVRAMVLNYSVFDDEISSTALRDYGGAGYMLSGEEMQGFWRNYVERPEDRRNPLACPIRAQLNDLPPAYLAIAECDILAEQNVAMAQKLRAAGVATEAVIYRGASHSFLEAVSIAELSARALEETSQWLRSTLTQLHRPRS
jgi:acetyl esterase